MTTIGELRELYSRTVEPRPSRFDNEGRTYRAWATRADGWGESLPKQMEIQTIRNDGDYARAVLRLSAFETLTVETTPHTVTALVPVQPRKGHPGQNEGHAATRARANRIIRAAWYADAQVNRVQYVTISGVRFARYDVIGCSLYYPSFLTYPGKDEH